MDGSGRRSALIAPFHRILRQRSTTTGELEHQQLPHEQQDLERYLNDDSATGGAVAAKREGDGSPSSPDEEERDEEELRTLKLQLLQKYHYANSANNWIASVPGRWREDEEDVNDVVGRSGLFSTCRMLVLTTQDYDGRALEALRFIVTGLDQGSLRLQDVRFQGVPKRSSDDGNSSLQSSSLDQRARAKLSHLAQETLNRLEAEESILEETLRRLSSMTVHNVSSSPSSHSFETALAYTRLGEIDAVRRLATL